LLTVSKRISERGYTLVEMLVAMFVLAVVGATGLLALTGATNARMQSNTRTTAVSLADSAIETIKGSATPYQIAQDISGNPLPFVDYTGSLPEIPSGYQFCTLNNAGNRVNDKVYGIPWDITTNQPAYGAANPEDPGIQKVTIIVMFNSRETYRLADFKVDR
jgi:prepilin-type N-terminal cleavage/methylation domain-containing protein